jgi:glycosyltransferase involved in cell wall biosynthesis
MEVIIVNDGSKDNTAEVADQLQRKYGEQIVRVVNKENGGHGSTINVGLQLASGKYTRVMDGDDWVNSRDLGCLIDYLEQSNADIVVTDYSEDIAFANQMVTKKLYQAMTPEHTYRFDDLCYDAYGFGDWGPILATGNFRTEMLRQTGFKLTEKSFYIDMEFDVYSILRAQTVEYLPLDIYRYYIGRAGQSISKESYSRNYRQHENVIFNILRIYESGALSERKKWYVRNKIIVPMIIAHYTILTRYLHSGEAYWAFEQKLSAYPEIYEAPEIATRMKKIHRKTKGRLVILDHTVKTLMNQ